MGSHPGAEVKPSVQQMLFCLHLLLPFVISFANCPAYAYIAGFTNPTELLPILMRAAFKLEIMAATAGHDAEVPEESH